MFAHILTSVESTGGGFYVPIYDREEQLARSRKVGIIRAPLKAHLDIEDVFDGRGTCLLDYISYDAENGVDEATHVVYLAKKGVYSTREGWGCEYLRKCKVDELPNREVARQSPPSHLPPSIEL